jgi:hypothetical protein
VAVNFCRGTSLWVPRAGTGTCYKSRDGRKMCSVPASLPGEDGSNLKNTGTEAGATKAGTLAANATPYLRNAVLRYPGELLCLIARRPRSNAAGCARGAGYGMRLVLSSPTKT